MDDRFETVIGLEVHAQLKTRAKLFCGCPNRFGDPPNTNVCPVCYGLPGALPVPNRRAVGLAVMAGLAFGCEIPETSVFERKNYFYPDLPKGYQITQLDHPVARAGSVLVPSGGGGKRRVRIHRIQLEEDAGKLIHDDGSDTGVDFNRAGTPLVEIVSEPDLRSADEAVAFARELRNRLRYCDVSDADMEKGNFRFDANVSVRERGATGLGVKVELKNLNSFRFLHRALAWESDRQRRVLASGSAVVQETRLFDEDRGATEAMRRKEEAADYGYFPDPDLPPVRLAPETVEDARRRLPELPDARAERFASRFGVAEDRAALLTARRGLADYFEAAVRAAAARWEAADAETAEKAGTEVANWVLGDVLSREKEDGRLAVPPERLGDLAARTGSGRLPRNAAREIFAAMAETGKSADEVERALGLSDLAGGTEIARVAGEMVAAHPDDAAAFRAGRAKVLGFLVGKMMRRLDGKADPRAVRTALERALGGDGD